MLQSYDALCAYLKRTSGLVLDASKLYLVESRVLPIVRREGLGGLTELVKALEGGSRPALAKEVVEAMTINETYFFRDRGPFDAFRDTVLPKLIAARSAEKRLRIWCAASSTGQEPYSLAILLEEAANKLAGWRVELIATDIAEPVLAKARSATYSQFEVQRGLSTPQLLKYFNQVGDNWQVVDSVRTKVSFRQLNLLSDFSSLGRFDVIFCRNVLIYFEVPTKGDILKRMSRMLAPDGYVILGASESVMGLGTTLEVDPSNRLLHIHMGGGAKAAQLGTAANGGATPQATTPALTPRAPSVSAATTLPYPAPGKAFPAPVAPVAATRPSATSQSPIAPVSSRR